MDAHFNEHDDIDRYEPFFSPPLWLQRRMAVLDQLTILSRDKIQLSNLVDLGCGSGSFLSYAKNEGFLHEMIGVDIDKMTLQRAIQNCTPTASDWIHFDHDLKMSFYLGSITKPNTALRNLDAAVCIEVIEHLPKHLLSEFPICIFGYLRPKVVIITTPNAEFNVLFDMKPGTMRHYDHKFEWDRSQFQTWCNDVASTYRYRVSFSGVGVSPSREDLGYCTQMATFIIESQDDKVYQGVDTWLASIGEDNHSLEEEIVYPRKRESSLQDKILSAFYSCYRLCIVYFDLLTIDSSSHCTSNDQDFGSFVPFEPIAHYIQQVVTCSPDDISKALEGNEIELHNQMVRVVPPSDDESESW